MIQSQNNYCAKGVNDCKKMCPLKQTQIFLKKNFTKLQGYPVLYLAVHDRSQSPDLPVVA